MQYQFLGYGSAFDYHLGNSSVLVKANGVTLLLDCGFTVYGVLRDRGLIDDISHVAICHLHNDHCGSLATLVHYRKLYEPKKKLNLIYGDEQAHKDLYTLLNCTLPHPEDHAHFVPASDFDWLFPMNTSDKHVPGFRGHAYAIKEGNTWLAYTSDLADTHYFFSQLEEIGMHSGTVLHDLSFGELGGHHTSYREVERYMEKYEIVGFHHDPIKKPRDCKVRLASELPGGAQSWQVLS